MIKVLILSNMYPSQQKPTSGIFVKNQYEYLRDNYDLDLDIYYMKRRFTKKTGSIVKYILFFIKFIPYLIKKRYDILHVHFLGEHFYLVFLYKFFYRKTKIVLTLHGRDIYKKHLFRYTKFVDKIIAVSQYQNTQLKEKYNVTADYILCAGVDRNRFFKQHKTKKKFDFLYVGSFFEVKGVDVLIDAIKKSDEIFRICFIGSGEYNKDIIKLKEITNSHITIINDINQGDLVNFYNKSRFLLFPSRDDSFGLVVTESLFSGTPVVVTKDTGGEEQIINGYNGYIIPKNNPDKLLDLMKTLSNLSDSEYEQLSINALNSNIEYSLNNVCEKLIYIYHLLLKSHLS